MLTDTLCQTFCDRNKNKCYHKTHESSTSFTIEYQNIPNAMKNHGSNTIVLLQVHINTAEQCN